MESKGKTASYITLGAAVACLIWHVIITTVPYLPSGTVIDAAFLNTLKWMTVIRYAVMIFFGAMIFVPSIVLIFKGDNKRNKIILATVLGIVLIAVITAGVLFKNRIISGITETPTVKEVTVVDKTSKGQTIFFDDDTAINSLYYQFRRVDVGDKAYVAVCDGVAIGVFAADEYSVNCWNS